jgi:hypothetical protein
LVGNPEGKRPLGRYKHGWEDKLHLSSRNEMDGVDWIHVA